MCEVICPAFEKRSAHRHLQMAKYLKNAALKTTSIVVSERLFAIFYETRTRCGPDICGASGFALR
ncbi:MAG: hypothetical protein RR009_00220 [Oscillospiraceae bacterium]